MLLYKFTAAELTQLLSTLIILVDSREQKNSHITSYFDSKKIAYETAKLDHGDYGAYIPADKELGLSRDLHFPIFIERKNSVDELAATIKERTRFENELIRSQHNNLLLLVEDEHGYENLIKGNYRSQYNAKALLASLKTFEARYHFTSVFISSETSGNYIYHHLYYAIREKLR